MALSKIRLSEDKIKIAMARKHYSTKDLSQAIGLTPQRVGAMFKNDTVLTSTAGKIADALDVDITEIIN